MLPPTEIGPRVTGQTPKVIRVPQGARKQLVFRLLDDDGNPINPAEDPHVADTEIPTFGAEKPASELTSSLRLVFRECYGSPIAGLVDGKFLDDCGRVQFLIESAMTEATGLFLAEIGWFVYPDIMVASWPCYLMVEPSAFAAQNTSRAGSLSVSEIRMAMFDHDISEASLLDDLEFKDLEIMDAAKRVVDMWNEAPPHLQYYTYTSATFPWRTNWINGTIGNLYRAASARYLRNHMPHQAGGIVIQDQAKFNEYQQKGDQLLAEFNQWMMRKKVELNMAQAWGGNGIAY